LNTPSSVSVGFGRTVSGERGLSGGGALNVNCFGGGEDIGGDDVTFDVVSAACAFSTAIARARARNDAFFFMLPLDDLFNCPMLNVVDGGVKANASLASESFGESTVMGSGDGVASALDARPRASGAPSLSNDAFNDRATRDDDAPSLAPSSVADSPASLRVARLLGLAVFRGIARNSNVFVGLARPLSRPNRSANAPHVTGSSPLAPDASRGAFASSPRDVARPPTPRRRAPRPLAPRRSPLAPRLNPAMASSSARTSAVDDDAGVARASSSRTSRAVLPLPRASTTSSSSSSSRASRVMFDRDGRRGVDHAGAETTRFGARSSTRARRRDDDATPRRTEDATPTVPWDVRSRGFINSRTHGTHHTRCSPISCTITYSRIHPHHPRTPSPYLQCTYRMSDVMSHHTHPSPPPGRSIARRPPPTHSRARDVCRTS